MNVRALSFVIVVFSLFPFIGISYGQTTESKKHTVLITYYSDTGHTEQLAKSIYKGALEVDGVNVVLKSLAETSIQDVLDADAIILGTPVYNANPAPEILKFIQSWPFEKEPLRDKIGAVFVTGGGISAGEELVQNALQNAMLIFGMVVLGSGEWTAPFGASAVTTELKEFEGAQELFARKGELLGRRVSAAVMRWNSRKLE
jgi:NAD(P)H dehydrogenase (quinone)